MSNMIVHLTKRVLDFYAELYKILNREFTKSSQSLLSTSFSVPAGSLSVKTLTNKGIGKTYCKPTLCLYSKTNNIYMKLNHEIKS